MTRNEQLKDIEPKTVENLRNNQKWRLEDYQVFYNHDSLEEALNDLKQAVVDEETGGSVTIEDIGSIDIEMDILYIIAAREGLEAEETVTWCSACDDTLIVDRTAVGSDYGMTRYVPDEGWVCGPCVEHDEMEPLGTVIFSDEEDYPRTIGYYHDRTEGEFEVTSTRHDAWRVSHSIKPVDEDKWRALNTGDVILSMSKDAEELKKMDDKLMEYARERGIRIARATGRTSNVFSTTYNMYVETSSAEDWELLELQLYAAGLRNEHRDDYRFRATALTGKDPNDFNEHDEKFIQAVGEFENGAETPQEAIERVQES